MTSRLRISVLTTLAFISVNGIVNAQPPGGGRGFGGMFGGGGGGGVFQLIGNEAVQKDIGIEKEAAEKLGKLSDDFRQEMMAEMQKAGGGNFQDLSDDERRKLGEKMAELRKSMNEKFTPKLSEILSKEQLNRVHQIGWQAAGSMALADPDVAKKLELSKEQQEKLMAVNQEFGQKQRELMMQLFGGGGGGGGGDAREKMQALNKERDEKSAEILSKDQQAKFAELKGKPFDLSQLRGPGGPGGPGGRPGAGGRPGRPGGGGRPGAKKSDS